MFNEGSLLIGLLGLAVGAAVPTMYRATRLVSLNPPDMLIVLSGARLDILKQVPTERLKFVQLGILVLLSALIATVSMVFALWHGVQLPLPIAIAGALVWGVTVLTLNRWLVASLPAVRSPKVLLLAVLPRVTLSVLLGVIITVPFILQIFSGEINAEIPVLQGQQLTTFISQQRSGPLGQQIASDQAAITHYESVIAAGGLSDPYKTPAVQSLNRQLVEAQDQRAKDYAQWQCELYGGSGCIAGSGPAAEASQRAYEADVQRVNSLSSQLTVLTGQLTAVASANQQKSLESAQQSLANAKEQLNTQLHQQSQATGNFNRFNSGTGLLMQLKALSAVASGNTTLAIARFVILAFFALIDCLPVLTQTLLKLGPPSTYDRVLALDRSTRNSIVRQRETMMQLVADRAISDLGVRFRSAANEQLRADRAQSTVSENEFAAEFLRLLQSFSADQRKRRQRDLDSSIADLQQAGSAKVERVAVKLADLDPFEEEAVQHEDGQLWRLEVSRDEFVLIDSLEGVPTLNWTSVIGAKEFASLVSERLAPVDAGVGTAEMTISVAGIEDQMDARLGVELAFLASPAFDDRSEFVRFDDEHVAIALQSMHDDEGESFKLFGMSSVELDLDMLVSMLARTGTPSIAAHAREAANSPLINRLSQLVRLPVKSGAFRTPENGVL